MPPDPFRGLGLHLLVASLLPLVSGQLGDWETTALCIHDSSCQLPYVTISTSFYLDAAQHFLRYPTRFCFENHRVSSITLNIEF